MKHFIFLLVVSRFLNGSLVPAKGASISPADSTYHALLVQPPDSNLVKALNNLGVQYELYDSAFAEKVYLKALSLSRQLKNPKLECKSLTNLGILFKTYNNLLEAGRYQQLNLSVAEKAGLVLEKGKALVNLGNVYNAGNQNSKALATYLKAVTYLEKAGDQSALSLTLGNIAHLYSDQSEYQISLKYAAQALEAGMLCGNANAIGSAYHNASYSLFHLNLLDSSYRQTLRAIPYLKQAGNVANLQAMYVNAASYHLVKTRDLSMAEAYSDSSLVLARNLPGNALLQALLIASSVAVEQKNLSLAEKRLTEAKPLAANTTLLVLKRDFEKLMSLYHKAAGNWKLAFEHKGKQMNWADSLNRTEEQQRTMELEARYQSARKQLQIKQLELEKQAQVLALQRRNNWIGGLAIGAFLIGLIGFLIYLNSIRKQKIAKQTTEIQQQKIKELEQERQIVATNSLLKGQDEERSRLARDLHDGLGGMLSALKFSMNTMKGNMIMDEENATAFQRSIGMLDNVIGEMRRVAHSMMPEALVRFGLKEATQDLCDQVAKAVGIPVHFQAIGSDWDLEKSVSVALYRIEQELLNNIVKHAQATQIQVQLVKDDSHISLTVEDNGKGFDANLVNPGAGLTSIRTRTEALGGSFDIQSKPEEGSSFLVELVFA